MLLSAHQPAYLPWLGYLQKIAAADLFVYLDAVQFEKNSFTNRNRIKTPQGPLWLTVPIKLKGHIDGHVGDLLIDDAQPWRSKHLKSIEMNYRKAAHFERNFPKLEYLLTQAPNHLAEACWQELNFWLDEFGIATTLVRQSSLASTQRKSELVLDLCRQLGADHYLSGAMGRDYLDLARFAGAGIEVTFQQFEHPSYRQLWGAFEPAMGIVDYWMNCGSVLPACVAAPAVAGAAHA